MRVLVTGASGFIGSKLVPKLIELGHEVRTFGRGLRPAKSLDGLSVEHFSGDVTDAAEVAAAVDGCQMVFHLAGLVSYRRADRERQHAVNVIGTGNVMQACLDAGVERVIHTSSIAGMGIPENGTIGTEDLVYNLKGHGLNYCDSKFESEQLALDFARRGLPVVVLSPGIIFGEGDTHPHHGAIFLAMSKGWLLGWPPGGVTFCDIEDVIEAHHNAMSRGRTGQRYVLGSANLTYREAALCLSSVLGSPAPRFQIPGWLLHLAGSLSEAVLPLLGKKPSVTRQVAWLSQRTIFFSFQKAMDELGYQPTPFEETIKRIAPYYLNSVRA